MLKVKEPAKCIEGRIGLESGQCLPLFNIEANSPTPAHRTGKKLGLNLALQDSSTTAETYKKLTFSVRDII